MALQLTQLRIPSLTTDYSAETNAAGALGKTIAGMPSEWRKQAEAEQKRQLFATAAQGGDLNKIGLALLGAGDVRGGAALLGLGQKAEERKAEAAWYAGNGGGTGQGTGQPLAALGQGVSGNGGASAPRPFNRPVQVAETEDDTQRLEADMARRAGLGYGNPTLPAGMRNNNPGNIKFVGTGQAPGVVGPSVNTDQGDPQAVFNSPEAGMSAAYGLAMRKYQGGKRTAMDLIAGQGGWTPGNAGAAANVARTMGVAPNEDLRLDDPQRAQAFMQALIAQEHGKSGGLYPREMIAEAVGGAQPAQGFSVPGGQAEVAPGLSADPQVQLWSQRFGTAPTEKARAYAKQKLDLAVKDAETRMAQGKTPETVREFLWARQNGMTTAKSPAEYQREKDRPKLTAADEVDQRKDAAAAAGVTPTDPRYQSYVLTGKTPREDAQPLSATDKKAILEADEGVLAGETAIRALNEAKGLSKQAMSGPTAGWRAAAGNNLPDMLVPDFIASKGASEATANLENTVTANALSQMKAIFGGNPTEGERKILLDIQGSVGQPDNVRQAIYDRGIRAAEARLAFNRQRAAELRGGDYYKGPGQQGHGKTPAAQAPQDGAPRKVSSPDELRGLPSGTVFIDPNGVTRRIP